MNLFLNKLSTYRFLVEDELYRNFFSKEYKGTSKGNSLVGTTLMALKDISQGASGMLKGKIKIPWQGKADSDSGAIDDIHYKDLVTHESDLTNFVDIIEKILAQMKQVQNELAKNLSQINFSYISESSESFSFKQELQAYQRITAELEKKEKEFASNLSQNIILKLSDMKEDTLAVIDQIKERLKHLKSTSLMKDEHYREQLVLENKCFTDELKTYCLHFDDNLYALVNEFLSLSKNLDKINLPNS